MSFFLLTIVFMIAMTALAVLRRKKKNASRSGRYRSPMGGGLMLDRPGSRRRKTGSFSLQPGHVFLGLVLLGMVSWVASGYFLSEGEPPNMIYESKADAASPEQYTSLGGQIFVGSAANDLNAVGGNLAASNTAKAQGTASTDPATSPKGPVQESSLHLAAQAALPADSRLGQVGHKLAVDSEKNKSASASAKAQTQNQLAVKAAVPPEPAAAVKKTGNGNPAPVAVSPAAQPQPKPQLATNKQPVQKRLLSASRQYTVHLGSFGEKGNAENYLAQLVAAGEKAFISESTVDGRLWHRVMSGYFDSRDDAESHGRDLKKRGLTVETGRYLVKAID